MRVIGAGCFVMLAMFGSALLMARLDPDFSHPWLLPAGIFVALAGSLTAALYLFNRPGLRPSIGRSRQELMDDLAKRGLVITTEFRAVRAFQVEEYDDEGLHYFIELHDGAVLYLNGQYLLHYEPITDDPEINQARRFPCSVFTIRRHAQEGHVLEIVCSGVPLEPEAVTPPFRREEYRQGRVPEDGEIMRDRTYAAIMSERQAGPAP